MAMNSALQYIKMLVRRYRLTLVVGVAILYLCLFKPPHVSVLDGIPHIDKVVHALMYVVLCSLLWLERQTSGGEISVRWSLLWAIGMPIALGGVIELAQEYLTASRSGDWLDLAADAVGVLIAAAAGPTLTARAVRKHKAGSKNSL